MTMVQSCRRTTYPTAWETSRVRRCVVRETGPDGAPKPKLLDRVRQTLRARHGSRRTEKAYVFWIKRYIFFHGKRHPLEMGAPEVRPS